jgi:hypothetical protein
MNDEKFIEKYPFGYSYDDMDVEAFMNLRNWLEKCLIKGGATIDGWGIGYGQTDVEIEVDIEMECHRYTVSIKPI